MMIHGRSFSAVLFGRIEIFQLQVGGGKKEISIQFGDSGNSIITENQIIDCYPIAQEASNA